MARLAASTAAHPTPGPNRTLHRSKSYSATTHDIADEFGVHPRTVRRYMAEGRIHGKRIGPRMIRFNLDEVRRDLLGDDAA